MRGSVTYNCVVETSLPLDKNIIGIDTTRLPLDGKVQLFHPGDTAVIHNTQVTALGSPQTAGEVNTLPRTNIESCVLYDQAGVQVDETLYTVDTAAGTVTMADPLDLSAYTEPLVASHTISTMAVLTDVQLNGEISLSQPLTFDATSGDTYVSNALVIGNVQAVVEHLFAQNTWTNVWDDALIGSAPSSGAQFDDVDYPISVNNRDAITQRWRLQFTSSSGGNVISEDLGIVDTFTTSANVSPLNPAGQPYFVIDYHGFGSGWSNGNLIRFNTVGAGGPVWAARTVLGGAPTDLDDLATVEPRWDKS